MADVPPGVIPVSQYEYDRLYPQYEQAKKSQPDLTFQQWLRQKRGSK